MTDGIFELRTNGRGIVEYHKCPRCEKPHTIFFESFKRKTSLYRFWGICHVTGEPVLFDGPDVNNASELIK